MINPLGLLVLKYSIFAVIYENKPGVCPACFRMAEISVYSALPSDPRTSLILWM